MTTLLIILSIIVAVACFVMWATERTGEAMGTATGYIIILMFYGAFVLWPTMVCKEQVKRTGYECVWDFFAGCQIKVNGQWIPYEKWRVVE